ncbi:MAG TPA: FAD-dependent oxidoreductase [Methylomirabilota bacterium]|nr:FAD-dependent oxidoreductase [Methylomirabilota bacterium]
MRGDPGHGCDIEALETAARLSSMPSAARVVVIGGGVVGASVAYHLARLGWTDVVLLERRSLTCGTTWHAAGLVGRLRGSRTASRLVQYSAELYARLEAETGHATGWRRCGSLVVARAPERLTQLRRSVALGRAVGIDAHVIGPADVARHWPLCRTDDLAGAMVVPDDGRVIPADVTQALAAGARAGGVRIRENVTVGDVLVRGGAVAGVATSEGEIACETVVNCAGMWARALARRSGVTVPLWPVEHFYAVTRPIDGVTPELPVLRDPDGCVYVREEVGGLLFGGFEPAARPWLADPIPEGFAFGLLKEDWEQFDVLLRGALERIPPLESAEVQLLLNGPESFTPDGNFILGEAPEVRGYLVAAGFNSGGIAGAGGAGRALAEWIAGGGPSMDLTAYDPRRFLPRHAEPAFLTARMREIVGHHYAPAWPNWEPETGRGLLRSPLHERLRARGACFGSKLGWERATWFAPAGLEPRVEYGFGRQNWFAHAAREHRAAREGAALFDQSSFGKLLLEGPGAGALLDRLAANDVAVAVGRTVYTPLLNERGGYESDLTVSRIGADAWFLVTGAAQRVRDADWIRRHLPAGVRATLTDETEAWATLGLVGPRSRAVLRRACPDALDDAGFPHGAVRHVAVAGIAVRAVRRSYAGELGWELYVPAPRAGEVWDALMAAGDVTPAGYYALDSLRIEKGYRAWGRELTPDDTPLQAGLEFTLRLDKPGGFLGRDALLAQRAAGVGRRLLLFSLEDPAAVAWGDEPIYRDGRLVGTLTSAAHGHTVGLPVAMGYVVCEAGARPATLLSGGYEIDVAGVRVAATPSLRAWHDPTGARLRGEPRSPA